MTIDGWGIVRKLGGCYGVIGGLEISQIMTHDTELVWNSIRYIEPMSMAECRLRRQWRRTDVLSSLDGRAKSVLAMCGLNVACTLYGGSILASHVTRVKADFGDLSVRFRGAYTPAGAPRSN